MCIIYLHAKLNIFNSNGLLIIVIKLKNKFTFQARAILLSYILHAQKEKP
jgi:hypothetical protein